MAATNDFVSSLPRYLTKAVSPEARERARGSQAPKVERDTHFAGVDERIAKTIVPRSARRKRRGGRSK